MRTKTVTIRLHESDIDKIDQIAEVLDRRFNCDDEGRIKWEGGIESRKVTRSDVLRAAVTGWLTDHEAAILDQSSDE